MVKTIGCIIARTVSTRLPKKVLKKIKDKMLIEYIIDKMKRAKNINDIILCTSVDPVDEILLKIAEKNNIKGYAGSRTAVIERMLEVAKIENADNVIRITGDNIFCDEIFINKMIELHNQYKADYTRTAYLPIGGTAEIYSVKKLREFINSLESNQTEYLSYFVLFKENNLKKLILIPPKKFQKPYYSLTVDTPEDFERSVFIINNLNNPEGIFLDEILELNEKLVIPHINIDKNAPIKLPLGNEITLEEYHRVIFKSYNEQCIKVELEEDFYDKNKY